MRLLVSVRTAREALDAASAGADLVDLKEPRAGALGALPPRRIVAIVAALRARFPRLSSSATTGDGDDCRPQAVLDAVETVGRCGVDYVKVGIAPDAGARALLRLLAQVPHRVVPVFLGDQGVDLAVWGEACAGGFAAVMIDTRDKRSGSLFDCVSVAVLKRMIALGRENGTPVGLAGSLRLEHVTALHRLAPDIAGFRAAVCRGERTAVLDADRVRALAHAVHANSAQPDDVCVVQ